MAVFVLSKESMATIKTWITPKRNTSNYNINDKQQHRARAHTYVARPKQLTSDTQGARFAALFLTLQRNKLLVPSIDKTDVEMFTRKRIICTFRLLF